MHDRWVVDASMGGPPFCLCPVEGELGGPDMVVVTGMNLLGVPPGGRVVGIVHPDGQEAVDAFYAEHAAELDALLMHEPHHA